MDSNLQYFRPPVLVGERVAWLGSGSGLPQPATVRWIGRIPEITQGWTVGIELDRPMPVGGIDGTWRKRKLFCCEPKRGLLVPVEKVMMESSFLKTRHSLGESFYGDNNKKLSQQSQDLIRKLSLPQSANSQEFIAKVLPRAIDTCRPVPSAESARDVSCGATITFKSAANSILNHVPPNELNKSPSSPTSRPAALTVANVKAFDVEARSKNDDRSKTLEELEKFKNHLDEWEKLKFNHASKPRRKKVGDNPESLYSLAKVTTDCEKALFLRVVGEKLKSVDDAKELQVSDSVVGASRESIPSAVVSPRSKKRAVAQKSIPEETEESANEGEPSHHNNPNENNNNRLTHENDSSQKNQTETSKIPTKILKIESAKLTAASEVFQSTDELQLDLWTQHNAVEGIEEERCTEFGASTSVLVTCAPSASPASSVTEKSESVSGPTPTIRKKKHRDASGEEPVPCPRRRSGDGRRNLAVVVAGDAPPDDDTASVLYEPAFLTAYMSIPEPPPPAMTDVRGTFRRIDEDDIERQVFNPLAANRRRPLVASVSVPGSTRKGFFSFLKWFRKNEPKDDLDLEDFNAPSVAGSPLFTRSRLGNATSVDTLYSIATVSSFAFVSGAQYQNSYGSDKRKKRRAPPPPEVQREERADASLPNTLEGNARQLHRRSVSESYKDRRSGAFAHVHGKRKAPTPPILPARDRLYPTLSSIQNGSTHRKKRPAPLPPANSDDSVDLIIIEDRAFSVVEPTHESAITANENVHSPDVHPDTGENPERVENDQSLLLPSNTGVDDQVVCNDTLRLERGVLKPNKVPTPSTSPQPPKIAPLSPVSPRPWYKRKSLEKRKERFSDDWMPEVGIPRPLASPEGSPHKFNFFSRGEDKKRDDKRKSGLSILTNISELDREAAEICRKEQALQERLLATHDAQFYSDAPQFVAPPPVPPSPPEGPKRNSTRELISLFNAIGSGTKSGPQPSSDNRDCEHQLPLAVCDKPDIKTAAVIDTKCAVNDKVPHAIVPVEEEDQQVQETSRAQLLFDQRAQRQTSPCLSISTITEISEPSSSAATLNQYSEPVWTCTRCTLENLNWKNRCDACSACKPNFNLKKMSERRKSEMELEIDWESELQKYFPANRSPRAAEVSSKLILSKTGDVVIETETKQEKDEKEKETKDPKEGDLDEIRKKRLAFFMKSLTQDSSLSLRDAAAKKSLDETEKLKLKEMLKEMKNSLPKYEAAKNRLRNGDTALQALPDVSLDKNISHTTQAVDSNKTAVDALKYGAIPKTRKCDKPAEALLVTTTTIFEDIIVRKNPVVSSSQATDFVTSAPAATISQSSQGEAAELTRAKKSRRRVGNGAFELLRARDLANIIETRAGSSHIYANYPLPKESDASSAPSPSNSDATDGSSGREVARLASQLTRAAGVAEFRASLDGSAADTLAVNRILRRLEAAIAAGRHDQAATLARELAGLKVNCSVIRQRPSTSPSPSPSPITVELYVEDKVSHQGPIPLRLQRAMTVADLKLKVQTELQIPCHVQRWILGKQLAAEDFRTLEELGVTMDNCPIFLYLVAPEPEVIKEVTPTAPEEEVGAVGGKSSGENPRPLGKGWYFNYEEDRYSFCESDSENPSPEREPRTEAEPKNARPVRNVVEETKTAEVDKNVVENGAVGMEIVSNGQPEKIFNNLNGEVDLEKNERDGKLAAVRVIQRTIASARAQISSAPSNVSSSLGDLEFKQKTDDSVTQRLPAKNASPKTRRPPLKSSASLPEQAQGRFVSPVLQRKRDDGNEACGAAEKAGGGHGKTSSKNSPEKTEAAAAASRPRSRSIFDLIKPQSSDTLKKDLKVISVNAVKETIEKLTRRHEDGARAGWRCDACTLLNNAPRLTCAACAAPRPLGYVPPVASPAEDELRRLRRAQDLDFPLDEPEEKDHYLELVGLDNADLVQSQEPFECPVCLMPQAPGQGVILRECLHTFCRDCLAMTIEHNQEAEVKCPYRDENYSCESVLQQREIKGLVSGAVFEQHLARGVAQAEHRMGNAFHCKTPDCAGWCVLDDAVNEFACPVCAAVNCLTCRAVHQGMNCRAYQDRLRSSSDTNAEARRTRTMLEDMVGRGDAMACPTCQVVLMKKWGCDWLRCSMCKTEICWVTRGPRWGPAGKGDTTAGCQCGVNGVKCHPKCNYCH